MKTFKVCLSFVLALSLFASSCTKEEELSKTELLTIEDGWMFDSTSNNFQEIEDDLVNLFVLSLPEADRTPENEAAIREEVGFDISEAIEDCDKDNVIIFNANKTLTELYGAVKCDPDEPNEETGGTWSFNADETQLTLAETNNNAETYTIQTLNENKLDLMVSEPITDFLALFNLTAIENVEGYDDFINSNFNVTLTFKSN